MSIEVEKGFHWVPAGAFYTNHGGLGIYIKYHRPRGKAITVRHIAPMNMWIECPDRDLVIVGDTHQFLAHRPMEGTYDEYVSLGFGFQQAFSDFDVDYMMVNYTQAMGKEANSPRLRRHTARQKGETRLISDSGGFQLGNNRIEFIDPKKVVEWYNDNVDIGIVLDIAGTANDSLLERSARVQQKNTQVMLDHKGPSLELMNVIRGHNPKARSLFREICDHPDIDRAAVADSYGHTLFTSISDFLTITTTGKKYKHYHMLGVLNVLQVVVLMRLVHYKFANLITSDSSTHIQEAVAKGYYMRNHIQEASRYISLGDKTNQPNSHNLLPCSCPVCSAIKYTDVLGVVNSNVLGFMLMTHNLYSTQQYIKSMWNIVQKLQTKELKAFLKSHLKSRNGLDETMKCLDFLDAVQGNGIAYARTKYRFYLAESMVAEERSLFSPDGKVKEVAPTFNVEDVIARYEQQLGTHGKKMKNSTKGHKIAKSKPRKLGGTIRKAKVKKHANNSTTPKDDASRSKGPDVAREAGADSKGRSSKNEKSSSESSVVVIHRRQRKEGSKA